MKRTYACISMESAFNTFLYAPSLTFISRDNKGSRPQSVILYREIVHLEFSNRVLIPYARFSPLYDYPSFFSFLF